MIREHFENEHAVYELATEDRHDHLVCTKSGRVKEFSDAIFNQRIAKIAEEHGFEYTGQKVHLFGVIV